MPKTRRPIPKAVEELILNEFNHRCAICGADKPQLHHIDEDPSNNETLNIIPLCPNCHLTDQHNPTQPFDPEKIKLFRVFKDPAILLPQFDPLFRRTRFLYAVQTTEVKLLENCSKELVEFIAALKMGEFYSKQVHLLATRNDAAFSKSDFSRAIYSAQADADYKNKLERNREKIISLAVELLRYQEWNN